jgi:hypothetical protein
MRRFGDGMANAGLMGLRGRMMDRRPAPMNRPMPSMPPAGGAPMAPPPAPPMGGGAPAMRKGGKIKKKAKGGSVSSASKRADGCATKGKTRGKFV